MLPSYLRLPKYEIENIFFHGKRVRGEGIELVYLKSSNQTSRFAVSVASTAFKKAVTRNKIKRLIREAIRLNHEKIPKTIDAVIVARKDFSNISFMQFTQIIVNIFIAVK